MNPYNQFPSILIKRDLNCIEGWSEIVEFLTKFSTHQALVLIETYQGVNEQQIYSTINEAIPHVEIIETLSAFKDEAQLWEHFKEEITEDRLFGRMTQYSLYDFFDPSKLSDYQQKITKRTSPLFIIGPGAKFFSAEQDLLIYADMTRWEIQKKMRNGLVNNLGFNNRNKHDVLPLYKQSYFVDWRVLDRHKTSLFTTIDFLLDTIDSTNPKLVPYTELLDAYQLATKRPFSVVPYFDPSPWGGQWMKEHFQLETDSPNYGWSFNCVPEENSVLFQFQNAVIELPSQNIIMRYPKELLGTHVFEEFGAEFPIRFDYLDTIHGGALSLQVHPDKSYISKEFNMPYTQDESYYLLETEKDAKVYLGFKNEIKPEEFTQQLLLSSEHNISLKVDTFVNVWPAQRHDHFLIPAGTIHCSGPNCMVLEISATPYIFTFKLFDWNRLGLDGRPRPINIHHGSKVLQFDRDTEYTSQHLINQVQLIATGDGWREERTGLHPNHFLETRRHWFRKEVPHYSKGSVEVLALVEGDAVIIESPVDQFDPVKIHYGEVVILPAGIHEYVVRPNKVEVQDYATMKAYVRTSKH